MEVIESPFKLALDSLLWIKGNSRGWGGWRGSRRKTRATPQNNAINNKLFADNQRKGWYGKKYPNYNGLADNQARSKKLWLLSWLK